ncbi:glycosyltransferase family 2 protein [Nocardioides sp.]|uniref:glycosyltransferase family 2 protein n=1 Tax=Nocardioides sp. TaxID=35761 RepID=UPI003519CBBC
MFSYVINHFSPPGGPAHLRHSTALAASLAAAIDLVDQVVVVDGSAEPDETLRETLGETLGGKLVAYVHDGRRLSFAEGYNRGLAAASGAWTVLAASDVYPHPQALRSAARLVERVGAETIGCIIPRLTSSDLPLQETRSHFLSRPVRVPLMTLNLNMFPTAYLRELGGIPEQPGGNFNDVLLGARIHRSGRSIWMVPDRVPHYGSLTLEAGGSSASVSRDRAFMAEHHPDLVSAERFWGLSVRAQSGGHPGLARMLRLASVAPAGRRARVDARVLTLHTALRSLSPTRSGEPRG